MYEYIKERPKIFTESGVKMLFGIWGRIHSLCTRAGACTIAKAIANTTGDSWVMLACIDYLDEIGYIRKITVPDAMTQDVVLILRREPVKGYWR